MSLLVFIFFGGLFACGVLVLLAIAALFVKAVQGKADSLGEQIVSGNVPELSDWHDGLFASLSSDVVGGSYFYRPLGGARTYKFAATVPACEAPQTLLALSAESTPRRGQAKIDVVTRSIRVSLGLHGSVWRIDVNGHPFGSLDFSSGRLDDARGTHVGWYRRSGASYVLQVRNTDVAWLEPDAKLHAQRAASSRPLLRLASPTFERDASLWLLAIVGFALSTSLLGLGERAR